MKQPKINMQAVIAKANTELSEEDMRIVRAAINANKKNFYAENYKAINAGAGLRHRKIRKL